ncbi:MAG: glycoside hydrolase family 38 C-terminal domain-containing protein [Acidimicrobiales bacterium]
MTNLDLDRRAEIERIRAEALRPARRPRTAPVTITARHLHGEPVPYAEAVAGDFAPFAEGDRWGSAWDTTWFHVTGAIPDDWAGLDVVLQVALGYHGGVGFGAEGQVWVDGRPHQGLSPNHREVRLAAPAAGGEVIDLFIEAAANPPADEGDPGPLLLAEPHGEPLLVLERCRLVAVDREVEELLREWSLVTELATWVGGERAEACWAALEAASAVVEADGTGAAAVAGARAALGDVLADRHREPGFTHLAVGNSHLDTAWLWPLRETRRKAARTFSTAATLLDREPEYGFAVSQPQQLAWIRDDHPDLWARLQQHVRDGRFEPVGAMWVEPDCNIPSGESLVRQLVHGLRFWRDALGADTDGLWLPDVFGYSAALPQILAQAGVTWFMTQKISWNDTNRFPHHTFWWEGIDGTRIFTHFPPADTYSGTMGVPQLLHAERSFCERDIRSQALYLYGHGDGGGGPDEEMVWRGRRLADVDGVGRVELVSAAEAIDRLRAEGDPDELPVWVGELYLELHRGTYTTMGALKRGNRQLEVLLREAELWAWAAAMLTGEPVPAAALDQAWETVLLLQFHDILPGSSIRWVNQEAVAAYDELRATVSALVERALATLAARVDVGGGAVRPALVANGLPFARDELVEVDGSWRRVQVPAGGWTVIDLAASDGAADQRPPVTTGDGWMANGHLRVAWDADGLVRSIVHLPTGREVVAPGAAANVLQRFEDRPKEWDAWDIDREALDTAVDLVDADIVELVEATTERAVLRVVRSFGASRVEQRVRLERGSPRLTVDCEVDWHEDHTLLKVAFPVDVHASSARHEIQLGHVERPTHRNTSWDAARFETCAHTWIDLSEDGFGVALLNDGKYGHDVAGHVIRLSLLRSPTWPDPIADRGHHRFSYALLPHEGSPTEAGVIDEAHALNAPLRVVPVDVGATAGASLPDRSSLVAADPGIVVTALKAADDGDGTVVRFHEAFGGRRRARLRVHHAASAERTDLLESPIDEAAGRPLPVVLDDGTIEVDVGPFELVTLRVRTSV